MKAAHHLSVIKSRLDKGPENKVYIPGMLSGQEGHGPWSHAVYNGDIVETEGHGPWSHAVCSGDRGTWSVEPCCV